jgi:flagellar biosynthesis chaperone FliJ
MSAFEEKMAILEGHATRVRDEVATLVRQLKAQREEIVSKATEQARGGKVAAAGKLLPDAPLTARRSAPAADTQLPELQQRYANLKRQLGEMEAERERRVRDEQAKLADLKLRFTSSHPQVITQEERIAVAAQVSSELALLRAEVKDTGAELEQLGGLARQTGTGGTVSRFGARSSAIDSTSEPLSADVRDFLNRDDADPALTTQLSQAVMRFGRYRDDVASARVQLDLAEAAFSRRYQIIVPAEAPTKASKPKPGVILGAGLFLSLLIALAIPIVAELRRGVMSERWQVHQLRLPLLAEVKLPPYAGE